MLSYVNFVNNKREFLQMYFVLFILFNSYQLMNGTLHIYTYLLS